MRVIAFDPGQTTGYAAFDNDNDMIWMGEIERDQVWDFLQQVEQTTHVMVLERFQSRPKPYADANPVEVIGVIKEFARQHGLPLVWQTPEQGKHFFSNDRLKERDVWLPGAPHAQDAARHLLYFLSFNKEREQYGF